MARTFQQVAMQVKLRCPLADVMLCRDWVQTAYNKLCDYKHFSFLRAAGELLIRASRSGTCGVTQNSVQVTAGTLSFTSADIGRQFRVGSTGLPNTIIDVSGTTAILEYAYTGTTAAAASGTVLDAFVLMPENFGHFIHGTVVDLTAKRRLHLWVSDAELSRSDPARESVSTSDPVALVSRKIVSQIASMRGRVEYEVWPYVTSERRIAYNYILRPGDLLDDDTFLGPLRERTDALVTGALAECALWPGPAADKPNPYFNLAWQQRFRQEFDQELEKLAARDEEIFLSWWDTMGFEGVPWAPLDANWRQAHGVPAAGAYYWPV